MEFSLIYRYLAAYGAGPYVQLGVGDDGAVLAPPAGCELVVSTDTQVEGRHFPADTLPELIATRAIRAAASDLAAMAAEPLAMTLALTLPEPDTLWLHSFSMGLGAVVSDLGLPLVGGDLTRGPLSLSVTVLGFTPPGQAVTRTGAEPGQLLCVSGTLGDAACCLALLEGRLAQQDLLTPEAENWLETRFYAPEVRLEYRDWLREHATACIDISDGLLADLDHIAQASGVGMVVHADALPLSPVLTPMPRELALNWALAGGDDYELAFTVPAGTVLPAGLSVIGEVIEGGGVQCDAPGVAGSGFDHFEMEVAGDG